MMQNLNELRCTVTSEYLLSSGEVQKREVNRACLLSLGRNEFKDIVLRLDNSKKVIQLNLKDAVIHRRFAKEGKATIRTIKPDTNLMISNCPPDRLLIFLKMLLVKLGNAKEKKQISFPLRDRLMSQMSKIFTDISPLSLKDFGTAYENRVKMEEMGHSVISPKAKRHRDSEQDKENVNPELPETTHQKSVRRKLDCEAMQPPVLTHYLSNLVITREQQKVMDAVLSGQNLFFTGSAGTGKSYLLKRIQGALPPQQTFVTASTGVAACHIGGTTLYAFAGIGSGEADLENCIRLASRPAFMQQWKDCQYLIIDEVSMIDGQVFDKLEAVARAVRQCDKAFGGIQLILCGDFLQLPPVTKPGLKRTFAFQSASWRKCIDKYLELKKVHRQADSEFINILQDIRLGRCTDMAANCLKATAGRTVDQGGITATRLCTHKDDVDYINKFQLDQLKTKSRLFQSTDSQSALTSTIDKLCAVGSIIELKQGTQVMLTKNLDVSKGLVNGARGVVIGFEQSSQGFPLVKFMSGLEICIYPEKWSIKLHGGVVLERKQLPLKLAWALSIHKSQGMTLDCVEITLCRAFEYGQAYVALSRARSLDGLRVIDFDSRCVRADAEVLKFYRHVLRQT